LDKGGSASHARWVLPALDESGEPGRCLYRKGLDVLSYRIDGAILILTASRGPQPQEVFDAVHADPRVPQGALVLIDARGADPAHSEMEVRERARVLISQLGSKVGSVCAVIVAPELALDAHLFQVFGSGLGLRVGLFPDEATARQWLEAYLPRS
jgi:hypothetical protein